MNASHDTEPAAEPSEPAREQDHVAAEVDRSASATPVEPAQGAELADQSGPANGGTGDASASPAETGDTAGTGDTADTGDTGAMADAASSVDRSNRPAPEWLDEVEGDIGDVDLVLKCLARDSATMCKTCHELQGTGDLDTRPVLARCAGTKQPR